MSPVLHKLARSEKGFTLAEVIIAMVVFVASIVGISMMLMSGSGAVTRGAMENAATQLAQKKLEEIKTLQFYTPWTGLPNRDVDDSYWNPGVANIKQLTTEQPHTNLTAYEDYGKIPGHTQFKRTTSIQYQIVTSSQLIPAGTSGYPDMNSNWAPKNTSENSMVPPLFDKPKDNSNPTPNTMHMLIAVVTVYYHDPNSGLEVSYKAQSVVSDLMTTGGTNNPILQVKSINPTSGDLNNTNFTMDVTVVSQGLTSSDTVSVYLWYEGQTDNPATTVTVVSPTLISCNFNLSDHTGVTVRPGVYSLAVYWQNKGWKDTSFRNCFTVTVAPPGFSTLTNHNWGHKGQSARPVVITGSNFQYATVNLQRNGTIIPAHGTTVSSDGTNINCTFDLTSISDVNTYWDIAITNRGGTTVSGTDAKRLLVNPTPVITDIAAIDTGGGTYNWGHSGMTSRKVKFEGKYLYGFDSDVSTRQLISPNGSYQTADATFVSGGTGNDCGDDTGAGNTGTLVLQYDLTTPSGATWNTPDSRWNPKLSNWGGQADISGDTQRFYMNPPAIITSIAATSSPNYYSWAHSGQNARNICITGNYLYGLQNTVVGNEKSLQYGNYSTTGAASLVSYTGDDSSPIGQNVVLTFNPSTASVGYNAVNSLWTVHLKNYGGVSESTTDATKVLFNPTPQITGITATASNYYNWATLGLGSRYVQVQGNYLYALNDSSALAQLSYGTNYTTDIGTGRLISGPTLNAEIGIGDAVTVNVQPSTAPIADKYSVPDSYWNVHLYNFGGTVDSNLNNAANLAVSVFMNPHPTVTTIVTGTSDTNWTYRAQTSRTVTITGTNLYSLNAGSPAAAKICYGYGASATTYNYFNGTYTDPGCNFALNTSYSVTMTFIPSSGNYSGTGANNGVYYELYLKNFGTPTAGYDTDPTGATSSLGICMNLAPVTVTDTLPATVTTGTAATIPASGGGTKTTTASPPTGTYTSLSVSGGYFQTGATVYFVKSNTLAANSPNVTFGGLGSITGDGASGMSFGSALTLNVTVGGSTTTNFYQYGTSNKAMDTSMTDTGVGGTGTYYVVVKNPDGQYFASAFSLLSHQQLNFPVSSKQPGTSGVGAWGTASSVGGGAWQDETAAGGSVTFTETPTTGGAYSFVQWTKNGTDTGVATASWATTVAATDVIKARFMLTLYNNGTNSGLWKSSLSQSSVNGGGNDSMNLTGLALSCTNLELYGMGGDTGGTTCSIATAGTYNFSGATNYSIKWYNPEKSTHETPHWRLILSTNQSGDYNDDTCLVDQTGKNQSSWQVNTSTFTGTNFTANFCHISLYSGGPSGACHPYTNILYFY
jgi:type II secretory pathway pseudopilin PulG